MQMPDEDRTGALASMVARLRPYRGEAAKLAGVAIGTVALIKGSLILFPDRPSDAFTLFAAALSAITLWLGRYAGSLALGLCAALTPYFLLEGEGFAVAKSRDAIGLIAFVLTGLFLVSTISSLKARLARTEEARAALAAEDSGKAALLSELSHRVFNDLGSLTSLALLQANAAEQPETREALRDIADRIQVFGSVYKRLHADAEQKGALDMRVFLRDLCADLSNAHLAMRPISLDVRSESYRMSVARAALVGLVLNEVVMNALKYAFPEERPGMIRVTFGHDPDAPDILCLTITDDGIGPTGTLPKGTGMGQRLLRAMASQLNGTYVLERVEAATIARLRFAEA